MSSAETIWVHTRFDPHKSRNIHHRLWRRQKQSSDRTCAYSKMISSTYIILYYTFISLLSLSFSLLQKEISSQNSEMDKQKVSAFRCLFSCLFSIVSPHHVVLYFHLTPSPLSLSPTERNRFTEKWNGQSESKCILLSPSIHIYLIAVMSAQCLHLNNRTSLFAPFHRQRENEAKKTELNVIFYYIG